MNKKQGNFIASLVVAVSICSIVGATPVEAKSMTTKAGSNYTKVTLQDTYVQGGMTNADGSISQATAQSTVRSNYLSGKLDSWSESSIIDAFKSAGLTSSDYYTLKAQKQSKVITNSSSPTMRVGWAKSPSTGKWYYSTNGQSWVTNTWQLVSGVWYYFDSSSQAVTGWHLLGENSWYYFDSNCAMASNTTIDGYTLGSDGKLISNIN